MSDNKPCPWCKHDDFVESNNYPFVQIECTNCGSMGPISRNRSDAMEKWNESMLMQEISMLQAALEAAERSYYICPECGRKRDTFDVTIRHTDDCIIGIGLTK